MHRGRKGLKFRSIYSVIAMIAVLLAFELVGWFAPSDGLVSNLRYAARSVSPSDQYVIVDIDAKSLAEVGVWPWPRTNHGQLLRSLEKAGAAAVAFDVDFSTHSNPESDKGFADALGDVGIPVYLAAFGQLAQASGQSLVLSSPIPEFSSNAWPALVNAPLDSDGLVRTMPAQLVVNGTKLTSLASLLGHDGNRTKPIGVNPTIDIHAIRHLSYVDAMRGNIPDGFVDGRTVIVGASALELHDFVDVPRFGRITGPELLALATETVLQQSDIGLLPALWSIIPASGLCLILVVIGTRRATLGLLLSVSIGLELFGIWLQDWRLLVLPTSAAQCLFLGTAIQLWLSEFGLRSLLLRLIGAQFRNSRNVLDRVMDDGVDGVIILNAAGNPVRSNAAALTLLGLRGLSADMNFPEAIQHAIADMKQSSAAPAVRSETRLVRSSGNKRVEVIIEFTVASIAIESEQNPGQTEQWTCLTLRDVTEERMAADRLAEMATHDPLTGLLNRRGIRDWVKSQEESSSRVTLMCFDLGRFDDVNHRFGYAVGDQILIQAGDRIKSLLTSHETLARLDGVEFAIYSTEPMRTASVTTEKIRQALGEPFHVPGYTMKIAPRFGLVEGTSGRDSFEDLLRRADLALHTATQKQSSNVAVFDPVVEAQQAERVELELELASALESGEIEVHYQPQVRLSDRVIVGAEALVRWRHPTRGLISPGLFIPLAEQTGLISSITRMVLIQACSDAANWPQPLKVAVNFAVGDFETLDIPVLIAQTLQETGLSADRLEVEITESGFIDNSDNIVHVFEKLTEMGIDIALDDFGTGYSSLGYLHRLPFKKIKIDKSFVDHVATDRGSMSIITSITLLAQGLGLKIVAEGIENEAQHESLRILRCGIGQGYLYSRPITQSNMMEMLSRGSVLPDALAANAPIKRSA